MYQDDSSLTERWFGFDFVKGLLIILVFVGHVIPGTLRETFPRYAIYSFHMPLFIGISGFLLNIEKIDVTFDKLFFKYWKRMGLPWVIAVAFYFVANIIIKKGASITLIGVLKSFCHPYYHLWYIMGFIAYLLISCFLYKLLKNTKHKWIILFFIVSIISAISKWDLLGGKIDNTFLNLLYETIQYDFRLYNLVFFCFGNYLRYKFEHNKILLSVRMIECIRTLMILSVICVTVLFFFNYSNLENIMYYIMNFSIILIIVYDCVNSYMPKSFVLEFIGRYSLPIYLYHKEKHRTAGIWRCV